MFYLYTGTSGVVLKIKLMCVVREYIEPADFARQAGSLGVADRIPTREKQKEQLAETLPKYIWFLLI